MSVIWRYFIRFVKGITIEPMFLTFYASNSIATFGSSNLILQKACHPGDTTAPDYSTPCPDEIEAQKVLTVIGSWRPILEYALPVIFIIFLGTWSDTHGKRRKPLLFLPLCGEFLTSIFLMFSSYDFTISPEVTSAILAILRGVTGGIVLFALGSITYIGDITSLEDRLWRIGLLTSLSFIGSPIGMVLAGILRSLIGFFNLFLICAILNIITFFLGALLMKNTAVVESELKTFEGLCDPTHFILSVKTLFKKRIGYNRLILWLMGLTGPLFVGSFYGETALLYLFVRNKFHIGEAEFGLYGAYKFFTVFVGTFLSVLICSKVFRLSDEVIGALGNVTQSICAIAMCFSAYTWQLYAFPLLDLMHGAVITAGRSITSKIVDGSELGQVNSFFGILDSLIPIVTLPLYNLVYTITIDTMPGAFFLFSVLIAFITFLMFITTYIIRKRGKLNEISNINSE